MDLLLHPVYFPNVRTLSCLLKGSVTWEIHDNYQKQTYRNRCYISTDRGKHMLNIPIQHVGGSSGRQLYKEVRLDNTYRWQRQHWRSLETAYRSAPFFEFFEDSLRPLFEKPFGHLLDFNLETTAVLCELLGLPFPTLQTAGFQESPEGQWDGRFLVNAKSESLVKMPTYLQVFGDRHGFVENLSGLDLLFNEGNASVDYLKRLELPTRV